MADDETKVYALNLFDVADREEYLAYSRRSAREVARHGGRVVALGRFTESAWSHNAPGSLSTVMVPAGSNAPKMKSCQLPDMLRTAAA